MSRLYDMCTGRRPVHFFQKMLTACALGLVCAPGNAYALESAAGGKKTSVRPILNVGQTIDDFYAARHNAPLWLGPRSGDASNQLINLLSSASLDQLDVDQFNVAALRQVVRAAATGDPRAVIRADRALSAAYVDYLRALIHDPGLGILYVDDKLRPKPPSARASLLMAASAPSLTDYLREMAWMNPIYVKLRTALADGVYKDDKERQTLILNLQRARVLPAGPQRYILVNAAKQELYMYDDGRKVDQMRVVVGQTKWPTPMITALVRFAAVNPYWYVPSDLAYEDVGELVEKYGQKYFDRMGYQQVSDWSSNPEILDATKINWAAVKAGTEQVYIRQKPGPGNFMGRMKFMFPNSAGVYLHDDPRKELFEKDVRFFSGGCVRLSDAARLGRWLFGYELEWQGQEPETQIPLPAPVPVYITYLTATPEEDGGIAYLKDAYERDEKALAGIDSPTPIHAHDSAVGSPDGQD